MPASWDAGIDRGCKGCAGLQREALTARYVGPALPAHVAGAWRGSDIAAAATIVANNTRRAHMVASWEWVVVSVIRLPIRAVRALPVESRRERRNPPAPRVGAGYFELPDALPEEDDPAAPELLDEEPPDPPPDMPWVLPVALLVSGILP